jgi:predicted peroxiredoxin
MIKKVFLAGVVAAAMMAGQVAIAGDTDPLFVNLVSDGHRGTMGLTFSSKQQERGHPLTVFLNDEAVRIAAKSNAQKFKSEQELIAAILAKGGTVIVCPMCMKHYGVAKEDLIPGVKISNPEIAGGALFKDNTKTLTW